MDRTNNIRLTQTLLAVSISTLFLPPAMAFKLPMWTFTPLTATTVAVPPGTTDSVQYTVSNQSSRAKNLVLLPTSGVSQGASCSLSPKNTTGSSCTLTLNITGSNLPEGGVQNGPMLCQANPDGSANPNQCYQPDRANVLHIVKLPELTIGQPFQGGVVACLNGGKANLIAATADNIGGPGIEWGSTTPTIGASAQSITDGASNTTAIVAGLGSNGGTAYAAQLCSNYEVDSQGNTPCQSGNTCYNDWFLPALNDVLLPAPSDQLYCLYTNRVAIGHFDPNESYWSSTEDSTEPTKAWTMDFSPSGGLGAQTKTASFLVRCVRTFTP